MSTCFCKTNCDHDDGAVWNGHVFKHVGVTKLAHVAAEMATREITNAERFEDEVQQAIMRSMSTPDQRNERKRRRDDVQAWRIAQANWEDNHEEMLAEIIAESKAIALNHSRKVQKTLYDQVIQGAQDNPIQFASSRACSSADMTAPTPAAAHPPPLQQRASSTRSFLDDVLATVASDPAYQISFPPAAPTAAAAAAAAAAGEEDDEDLYF